LLIHYTNIAISKTPIIQLSLCNIPRDYRYNSIRIIRLSKYSVLWIFNYHEKEAIWCVG